MRSGVKHRTVGAPRSSNPRFKALALCRVDIESAHKVKLDRGGYDSRGEYFGRGEPLYEVERKSDGKTKRVRASDRKSAITTACTPSAEGYGYHWK